MRLRFHVLVLLSSFLACQGQPPFGTELLRLEKEILLPDVKGRIDHMAINPKGKVLYVAALGNNTVEVIDMANGRVLKSIKGVEEPQGIAYLPAQNEIAVASGGSGDCVFFNASTFAKVATVRLAGDADNIRYDSLEKNLYVGFGSGGLARINPATHRQTGEVKLPAHPESFQLDKKNNRLYANLPDVRRIAVIDLQRFSVVDTWKMEKYSANFPMSLDTATDLVFVGFRQPATLVVYNAPDGKQLSESKLVEDVDDLFCDPEKGEVIASGGGGFIQVFKREKGAGLKKVANIPTRAGARTSLLVPFLKTFVLAQSASGGKAAAIAVYTLKE